MRSTIDDWRTYSNFTEAYEVVQTLEVVGGGGNGSRTYRIEILRALGPSEADVYSARYGVLDERGAWRKHDAGWVRQSTREAAAWQALGFLSLSIERGA